MLATRSASSAGPGRPSTRRPMAMRTLSARNGSSTRESESSAAVRVPSFSSSRNTTLGANASTNAPSARTARAGGAPSRAG